MSDRMPVVRLDAQRNATTIGWCNAMRIPPHLPGFIKVNEPAGEWEYRDTMRSAAFEVIEIRHPNGAREPAIQAREGNTPLEWLPGWAPV